MSAVKNGVLQDPHEGDDRGSVYSAAIYQAAGMAGCKI